MLTVPPHVRGLIFDCDGTIADTMPMHYRAWVAALGEHGVEFAEALFYELAGVPTEGIVRILNERHGHHMPVRATADRKDHLSEAFIADVLPIRPVVDVVRAYRGRLPMAVASGGNRPIVLKTLAAVGLADVFDAVVTAEDVSNGKPAPDIFLEAARRIGVEPGLCAGFEDGELGLQALRAAGMMVFDVRPAHLAARAST